MPLRPTRPVSPKLATMQRAKPPPAPAEEPAPVRFRAQPIPVFDQRPIRAPKRRASAPAPLVPFRLATEQRGCVFCERGLVLVMILVVWSGGAAVMTLTENLYTYTHKHIQLPSTSDQRTPSSSSSCHTPIPTTPSPSHRNMHQAQLAQQLAQEEAQRKAAAMLKARPIHTTIREPHVPSLPLPAPPRTVPQPFVLRSVELHEAEEWRRAQDALREEEQRRKMTEFKVGLGV